MEALVSVKNSRWSLWKSYHLYLLEYKVHWALTSGPVHQASRSLLRRTACSSTTRWTSRPACCWTRWPVPTFASLRGCPESVRRLPGALTATSGAAASCPSQTGPQGKSSRREENQTHLISVFSLLRSSVAERICEHSPLCSKLAGILTHIKLGKFGFLDLAYSDGAFVISTDVSSHDRTMYAFCALVKWCCT